MSYLTATHTKTVLDGKISDSLPPETLTHLYVYQEIHVLDGIPLLMNTTMEMLGCAFSGLFGGRFPLTQQQMIKDINELLTANRFDMGSFWLRVFASPDNYMLMIEKQIVYRGPVLWHARPRATIINYNDPLVPYPTTALLQSVNHADFIAVNNGYDMALQRTPNGILYAPFPLIGVWNGVCYMAPLDHGGIDSPWRQAAFSLFVAAGIDLKEEPLDPLVEYDELLYICPLGIVSLKSVGDRLLFNSYANRLAVYIQKVVV